MRSILNNPYLSTHRVSIDFRYLFALFLLLGSMNVPDYSFRFHSEYLAALLETKIVSIYFGTYTATYFLNNPVYKMLRKSGVNLDHDLLVELCLVITS